MKLIKFLPLPGIKPSAHGSCKTRLHVQSQCLNILLFHCLIICLPSTDGQTGSVVRWREGEEEGMVGVSSAMDGSMDDAWSDFNAVFVSLFTHSITPPRLMMAHSLGSRSVSLQLNVALHCQNIDPSVVALVNFGEAEFSLCCDFIIGHQSDSLRQN